MSNSGIIITPPLTENELLTLELKYKEDEQALKLLKRLTYLEKLNRRLEHELEEANRELSYKPNIYR